MAGETWRKTYFVFESKNYSGWIFGDEKGQYWTTMLPNNASKVAWKRCELKKVQVDSQDIKVIELYEKLKTLTDVDSAIVRLKENKRFLGKRK